MAGGLVVAVSRQFLSDAHTPFVELAVLLPFSAAAVVVAAFAAWAVRRRRLAVVATALTAVHLAMLAPAMGLGVQRPDDPAGAPQITVMAFNTLTGYASASAVLDVVRERHVDVVALAETTPELAVELRRRGIKHLLPYEAGRATWGAAGTTLWSRLPLQYVGEIGGTTFDMPQRAVRLPDGTTVTFTAVHTLSPLPGRVAGWRSDLQAVVAGTRAIAGPQVVLGDFNATRDHAAFRDLLEGPSALTDAAESVGLFGGAWPGFTWPTNHRAPLFMRLDHVLVTPSRIAVRSLDTVRIQGSDHLALVARLAVVPAP